MSSPTTGTPVLLAMPGAVGSNDPAVADLHIGVLSHLPLKDDDVDQKHVLDALAMACRGELLLKGVSRANLVERHVSLPFNMPFALKTMMKMHRLDVVICIGTMTKDATKGHSATPAFDVVAEAVTRANMKVGIVNKTPVVNGVLTCQDVTQARSCAGLRGEHSTTRATCNYGVEWAQTAIAMGLFNRRAEEKKLQYCECACHCTPGCACACDCSKCQSSALGCGCSDCICRKCSASKDKTPKSMPACGSCACEP